MATYTDSENKKITITYDGQNALGALMNATVNLNNQIVHEMIQSKMEVSQEMLKSKVADLINELVPSAVQEQVEKEEYHGSSIVEAIGQTYCEIDVSNLDTQGIRDYFQEHWAEQDDVQKLELKIEELEKEVERLSKILKPLGALIEMFTQK